MEIEQLFSDISSFVWSFPLIILLIGGGLYLIVYSRFIPFKYFFHAIDVVRGKYDNSNDDGEISHFAALSTALSATVGMGNIAGVSVAISIGGPGAIFWMWVSGIIGMSTKFFTSSLAIMYRGKDDLGELQGGPMYVIREALGGKWLPLAWMFAIAGMFGTLPVFQINQLVQILRDVIAIPAGLATDDEHFSFDFISSLIFG